MHARYRAMRGARLFCIELAAYIGKRVFFQRNGRIPTLLRAIMHQPILANVEIAGSGTTAPLIRTAERDVVLEGIHPRKAAFLQSLHLVVHTLLVIIQGLNLPRAVVDDSHS